MTREAAYPELARLVTSVGPDFFDLRGELLQFFIRDLSKRNVRNVDHSFILAHRHYRIRSQPSAAYLCFGEAVIDDRQKAICAHSVAHYRCKLGATFGSPRFGEVDDREIHPVH